MTRSASPSAGLDESWASLDPSEYSHNDDLHEETLETGSLVDLSSTHDTDSVAAEEANSDIETDSDEEVMTIEPGASVHARLFKQEQISGTVTLEDVLSDDMIVLQEAEIQDQPDCILLEGFKSVDTLLQTNNTTGHRGEKVEMLVSRSLLDVGKQAFQVAYYGQSSASDSKEELLGKIGAAVVLSTSTGTSSASASLYNIVPTEFGPGSKPTFAGLVPSQAQMAVEDIALTGSNNPDSHEIRITSSSGVVSESKPCDRSLKSSNWHPDLFVVHLSQDDIEEDFASLSQILKLVQRHHWPCIIVTQELNHEFSTVISQGLNSTRVVDLRQSLFNTPQPIGIDSFVALDTEQLNRHFSYLLGKSNSYRGHVDAISPLARIPAAIRHYFTVIKQGNASDPQFKLYTLPTVEVDETEHISLTVAEQVKHRWTCVAGRHTLKDTILSLAVVLLGMYIVNFSRGLTQNMRNVAGNNLSTSVDDQVSGTPTATALVDSQTLDASSVVSADKLVVMYDPISLDQVWNRLTGRSPDAEQEPASQKSGKNEVPPADTAPTTSTVVSNDLQALVRDSMTNLRDYQANLTMMLGKLTNKQATNTSMLHAYRNKSWREKVGVYMARRKLRKDQQAQVEEVDREVRAFWAEISKNIHSVGEKSHDQFKDLVRHSQKHLRRARWATGKRLEDIVSEQKKLLGRAQHQARVLKQRVPQQKRRSFFRKG